MLTGMSGQRRFDADHAEKRKPRAKPTLAEFSLKVLPGRWMHNYFAGGARKLISDAARATLGLRLFGLLRIPMLFYVRPRVTEISPERITVRIPLRRRTKNHHGSMYFGALGVGADCAAGALACI